MHAETKKAPCSRKWLLAGGTLLALLSISYLVLTSGPVVKALILPRVASAAHADLTAGTVKVGLFSGIVLEDVTLTPAGGSPLVKVQRLKASYSLLKLLGGTIAIDDVQVDGPALTIRQRPDGGSNLADWLARLESKPAVPPTAGSGASEPLQLAIGKVALRDGSVRLDIERADGSKEAIAVESLTLNLDQLRNLAASELKLEASVQASGTDSSGTLVDALKVSTKGTVKLTLDKALQPGGIDAAIDFAATEARGRFAQGSGLGATLRARGSLKQLDDFALSFLRGQTETGRLQAKGGYDPATGNGAFEVGVNKLPPIVLALAAVKSGLDFQLTDFSSTNRITINRGGRFLATSGELLINGLRATKLTNSTPRLDLALSHSAEVDADAGRISVGGLNVAATQNGQPLLTAQLAKPLHHVWKGTGTTDGALMVALSPVRISDWRLFTGELPADGLVAAKVTAGAGAAGQPPRIQMEATLDEGWLATGTNRIGQVRAVFGLDGELGASNVVRLSRLSSRVTRANESLFELAGNGELGLADESASAQITLKADLPALARLAGDLPAKISGGGANLQTTLTRARNALTLKGRLNVTNLNAEVAGARFEQIGTELPFEVSQVSGELRWRLADGSISEGGATALQLASTGRFKPEDKSGSLELSLPLLNERLLNPVLAAHAPHQRLRSARASLTLKGELPPMGVQTWALSSQSTNVVLVNSNGVPIGPMLASRAALSFETDAVRRELVLRQWSGHLFADGRDAGEFSAEGKLHLEAGTARLRARLEGLNEHALRPVTGFLLGEHQLDQARLGASVELEYDATRPSKVQAHVELAGLKLREPAGRFPESPQDLKIELSANVASNRLDLVNSRLQMTPSAGLSNRLDVTGWVDFTRPDALRGDLAIHSPGLDLSPLYTLIETRRAKSSPTDVAEGSPPDKPIGTTNTPFALPVDRLALAADVQRLKLRELNISNWVATAVIQSNAVNLSQCSLRLNEAPINARFSGTNVNGAAQYQLAAEIEGLRFAPVIATFVPEFRGQAEAELFAAIHLSGNARRGQSPWSGGVGEVFFGITNANYQPLSDRWQKTLRPVGLLLQTPELFASPINWAYLNTQLTNQTLAVNQFTVISAAYVMDVNSAIPLAAGFTDSAIPPTPVNLHLSRNLITHLGLLNKADTNTTRFVKLPDFATITGTLGQPSVETDRLKLTGMTLGKAGDFVGGSAGEVLKKAGGLTGSLGEIVSGRKLLGAESAEGNPLSKGIEGVFNTVGNILGGTGTAVEKGTGAVTGVKVEPDIIAARLAAFNWPRVFTNAPAAVPTAR